VKGATIAPALGYIVHQLTPIEGLTKFEVQIKTSNQNLQSKPPIKTFNQRLELKPSD
jgi:hypothetical protein